MQKSERIKSVHQIMLDPPLIHFKSPAYTTTPGWGVWQTDVACYELLATVCEPGTRTLETGLGVSTALFAEWRCAHTCVVPWQIECDRLVQYLKTRGIDDRTLHFEIGYSADVLPHLEKSAVDVVFIDGGHGFPTAIIDWYYGAGRLVSGGLLVVDDLHLAPVTLGLLDFLDSDPRWEGLVRTGKWGAWKRRSSGSLHEEWNTQEFIVPGNS